MAFLDKIGKKIGNVAGTAADKAKDLAETTKLHANIASEEKKVLTYYQEIGEIIFQQDKDNPDSPAAESIKKVLAAQQLIVELRQKIADIKNDKDEEDSAPADTQGNAAEEQPQPEAQITCPNCGASNPATNKFCLNCGTALATQE